MKVCNYGNGYASTLSNDKKLIVWMIDWHHDIETKLANDHLILLRAKEREKEVQEEEKRKADARKKEELLNKRAELQRLKEKKVQLKKQRMIDLVSRLMVSILDHFLMTIDTMISNSFPV